MINGYGLGFTTLWQNLGDPVVSIYPISYYNYTNDISYSIFLMPKIYYKNIGVQGLLNPYKSPIIEENSKRQKGMRTNYSIWV